ncbi:MAG TPA: sugar transferase [Terracidiphilus sp.]|nr:sugar transferase [Terracidiphilus sp.]
MTSQREWGGDAEGSGPRSSQRTSKVWILLDVVTIGIAAVTAVGYKAHLGFMDGLHALMDGAMFHGKGGAVLLGMLLGFGLVLVRTSRKMHLYTPERLTSFLHEQRLSFQACFTSGLLLTGAVWVTNSREIPRTTVIVTVGLVALGLGVRRFVYRILLYRRFERGVDTRNVLIVGTGPEAHALRHHLERIRHLGYTFKGFIEMPGTDGDPLTGDMVGSLESLFQCARKQFVDEIFFTSPCEREVVQGALEKARIQGIDLRLVPDLYGGLVWNNAIEYIGQFPTVPLHRGQVPEMALVLKRIVDVTFSALVLLLLSPVLAAIAIAIKLDSPGPVFYLSDRIGKKARVFRCIKYRTMASDAEKRRTELMDRNERDGVLFKVTNDPRITRVGRWLRKYSLDELPQFLNVLTGDMSVVGPRPPIASEVQEYKLNHLRRLDVTPGITGLWQVQGRKDPSFDSYVSLDVNYIENWSLWLDLKIVVRTVGVVIAGTGS